MKGPVFTTFLLADEINRAPAKTQSALLQAMQERTVTIDRVTHRLSPHFTVFATQNPIEFEGTYPLPEAQKDRFLLKIYMDHPQREEERELAKRMLGEESPEKTLESGAVKKIITPELLTKLQQALVDILVKNELIDYLVDIVRSTRLRVHSYSVPSSASTTAFRPMAASTRPDRHFERSTSRTKPPSSSVSIPTTVR